MSRRGFLRFLGLAPAVIVAAPLVTRAMAKSEPTLRSGASPFPWGDYEVTGISDGLIQGRGVLWVEYRAKVIRPMSAPKALRFAI